MWAWEGNSEMIGLILDHREIGEFWDVNVDFAICHWQNLLYSMILRKSGERNPSSDQLLLLTFTPFWMAPKTKAFPFQLLLSSIQGFLVITAIKLPMFSPQKPSLKMCVQGLGRGGCAWFMAVISWKSWNEQECFLRWQKCKNPV